MKLTRILIISLLLLSLLVGTVTAETTWLNPAMTTNTTPEGVASESSFISLPYYGNASFDHVKTAIGWTTVSGGIPGWLQYKFSNNTAVIVAYNITSSTVVARTPKDWTIKGSKTGAFTGEEITLSTITGQTSWGEYETRIFTISNPSNYTYYRMDISANNGDANYIQFTELELWGEFLSPPVSSFTTNTTSGVSPLAVLLTDTSTNTPTSWAWGAKNITGNDTWIPIGTVQNQEFAFPVGNWSVNMTATNGAGSNISTQITHINVSSGTQIPIAISSLSRLAIQAGSYIWFNDTSLNSPTAYCWTFGDGTFAAVANGSKTYYQRTIQNVSSCPLNGAGTNCSYNIIRVV
jgi:PKD repeat protein